MALANYSDLLAAVGNWLNRSDLTARIPDFIVLAEAEFNRLVRTPDMEATANVTVTSGAGSLPADCLGVKTARIAGAGKLNFISTDEFDELSAAVSPPAGNPDSYTEWGSSLHILPSGNATVAIRYFQKIPALTVSNATNWLMTRHPDLYLYATLVQSEAFGWNDERLPLWRSAVEQTISQINADGQRNKYGGLIAARSGPSQVVGARC